MFPPNIDNDTDQPMRDSGDADFAGQPDAPEESPTPSCSGNLPVSANSVPQLYFNPESVSSNEQSALQNQPMNAQNLLATWSSVSQPDGSIEDWDSIGEEPVIPQPAIGLDSPEFPVVRFCASNPTPMQSPKRKQRRGVAPNSPRGCHPQTTSYRIAKVSLAFGVGTFNFDNLQSLVSSNGPGFPSTSKPPQSGSCQVLESRLRIQKSPIFQFGGGCHNLEVPVNPFRINLGLLFLPHEFRLFALPLVVLRQIFALLTLDQRLGLRLICKDFCAAEKSLWANQRFLNVQQAMEFHFKSQNEHTVSRLCLQRLAKLFHLYSDSKVDMLSFANVKNSGTHVARMFCLISSRVFSATWLGQVKWLCLRGCWVNAEDLRQISENLPNLAVITLSMNRFLMENLPSNEVYQAITVGTHNGRSEEVAANLKWLLTFLWHRLTRLRLIQIVNEPHNIYKFTSMRVNFVEVDLRSGEEGLLEII